MQASEWIRFWNKTARIWPAGRPACQDPGCITFQHKLPSRSHDYLSGAAEGCISLCAGRWARRLTSFRAQFKGLEGPRWSLKDQPLPHHPACQSRSVPPTFRRGAGVATYRQGLFCDGSLHSERPPPAARKGPTQVGCCLWGIGAEISYSGCSWRRLTFSAAWWPVSSGCRSDAGIFLCRHFLCSQLVLVLY